MTALVFGSRIARFASGLLIISSTAGGGGEGVSEPFGGRFRESFLRVVGGCWFGLVILLGCGPKARVRCEVPGWADFRRPGGIFSE